MDFGCTVKTVPLNQIHLEHRKPIFFLQLHTARSIEIVPRGGPPLKMGGPPLEFINIQPPKEGPPIEFIKIQPPKGGLPSMDLAVPIEIKS